MLISVVASGRQRAEQVDLGQVCGRDADGERGGEHRTVGVVEGEQRRQRGRVVVAIERTLEASAGAGAALADADELGRWAIGRVRMYDNLARANARFSGRHALVSGLHKPGSAISRSATPK